MGDLLKALRCVLIYLALFACLTCLSCSDSGSSGNATSEDVVQTLDTYNFTLQVFDNSSASLKPLSADMAINYTPAVITMDTSEPITGNYSAKDEKYTINGLPNQFRITITMNDNSSTTFTMQLREPIVSTGTALPTQGEFRLYYGGKYTTVAFVESPSKGVTIDADHYTWKDIDGLLRSSTNQLKQEAALAATLISLLMDQVNHVVFTQQCTNKYKLTDGTQVAIPGDTFPPTSVSATHDNLWLTWADANKDKELGQGDSFNWVFNSRWEYDPSADVGWLYSLGRVDMKNYSVDIQPRDDKPTLISFGFPKDEKVIDSGVFYDDLDIVRTLNVTDELGSSIRLSGGFWINLQGS